MVLVQHILGPAQKRLAVLSSSASVCDAAAILTNPGTPLVVVCNGEGVAVGVISRTDVVKVLASARAAAYATTAGEIMVTSVLSCDLEEALQRVWTRLNARALRCAPILDIEGRPQGVVHARDIASALLDEANNEEDLLRDYVLGIGYQ